MTSAGPFSIDIILLAVTLFIAWLIARLVALRYMEGKQKMAGSLLLDAAFWGFLIARTAYIIQWWPDYASTPLSIIAIGDGGYIWWAGLIASICLVWWRSRSASHLRLPVMTGIVTGMLVWFGVSNALSLMQRTVTPLPNLQLTGLDKRPVSLKSFSGKPIVLNLWASWCPPCRREMPAFEQIQEQYPDISFVMVNQGESAQKAETFLKATQLNLKHVLLDLDSAAMQAVRTQGLPTTLFFDEQGQLRDAHVGEITLASLKSKIQQNFAQFSAHDTGTTKE